MASNQVFERFRQGDELAFKEIFDEHVGLVQYVASKCGLSPEKREDVAQEVFLRLYNHRESIESVASIKSWLVITAKRLIIDEARKYKRRQTTSEGEDLEQVIGAGMEGGPSEVDKNINRILAARLLKELAKTPGGECMRLFYIEGLTAKEIAERSGETVGTVTSRLTRLRRKFQERVSESL